LILLHIIKEEVYNFIDENNNIWFHGTPDNRELMKGGFQERMGTTDVITDPQKWNELQNQMAVSRQEGNEDVYWNALNQVGSLKKQISYKKPIFFTDKRSVANTYTDAHRSVDYQNAEPSVQQVHIDDSGNILKVPAYGERFRGIKADVVKNSLMKAGIPEQEVDKYYAMFPMDVRNGKMSAETLGMIAQQLGFDIVDVLGVYDSYHGGNIKSTVRMVFDPKRIKLI
jgi:hypothetical protein